MPRIGEAVGQVPQSVVLTKDRSEYAAFGKTKKHRQIFGRAENVVVPWPYLQVSRGKAGAKKKMPEMIDENEIRLAKLPIFCRKIGFFIHFY
ncbi:MAG TPA: hypothetical protein DF383_00140 [Deltaproteobacteria bacterium]|nr:hypothetical protein [Deltaproteobacteria bacterium]